VTLWTRALGVAGLTAVIVGRELSGAHAIALVAAGSAALAVSGTPRLTRPAE
jgi:hypothetical protein